MRFPSGTYDDLTLIDPRRVPLDDELRNFCLAFKGHRGGVRNSLTPADFDLLLAFARRAAVFGWIEDGLCAVALVDDERADARDIDATLALLHWTATRSGADANGLFARAAKLATRNVARRMLGAGALLMRHAEAGHGFVDSGSTRYQPRVDLGEKALAVRAMLERDHYRVEGVTIAASLPPVWFDSPDAAPLLEQVRGTASVHARHRADERQILIAFIADVEGARELAAMARRSDAAIVATAEGSILIVLIAHSFMEDVESIETTASMQRFLQPLRSLL